MKVWYIVVLILCVEFVVSWRLSGVDPVMELRENYAVLLEDKEKLAQACENVKNYGKKNICDDPNSKNKTCKQIWSVLTEACQDFSSLGKIGDWFTNVFKEISKSANKEGNKL